MIGRLRAKLTYSKVIATLCLFLALSGGTAVALKGRNTVNSGDIKDGAVKGKDIRDGTIETLDIGQGEVGAADRAPVPATRVSHPHDAGPPCAGGQPIPAETDRPLLFAVEEFDPEATHVNDPRCENPRRSVITAPLSGVYEVGAGVEWPADGSGTRALTARVNGVRPIAAERTDAAGGEPTTQAVQTVVRLRRGDFVQAVVHRTGAGTLTVDGPGSYLSLAWLGP